MEWQALRRVITDNDTNGRSRVLIDGAAAKLLAVEEAGLAEVWSTPVRPGSLLDATDRLSLEDVTLEPAAGCVKVRWFTVPPDDKSKTPEEREAQAAFGFAAAGAAHCRTDTVRHPMMHKTDTLDVIIPIQGCVDLLLDEGDAVRLKPGDVVIQRATNHAWINHGGETALLVAVLINAGQQ